MKLLLVSHSSGPYGAERVLLELARRLAARGHDVVLALPHAGPAADLARELPGVTLRIGGRRRLPRSAREAIGYFLGAPADALRVRRLVLDVAPDVTWINSMYNAWAAMGARLAGSPTVWHLHERSMRGPPGWVLAGVLALTADRAMAVSHYVAETFRHYPWLGSRVDVLANPLLRDPAPPVEPPEGSFTVGCVGQLEPRKRSGDLVGAVALLPEDVRGVFVGDGKHRAALEAAIRKSGVEERIEVLGFREDVPEQLARFHCLAIPSLEEPFGLIAVEAMSIGLPVIAARSGALPEVLGEAALYHEPGDSSDLARQIRRLRDDPTLYAELRASGLARAAGFAPERWIESAEAILTELGAPAVPGGRDLSLR